MNLQPTYGTNYQNDDFTRREKHAHYHDIVEGIAVVAGSFLLVMLAFRFIFALFGANPANGFASFVYSFTAPFTMPFYNLFSYDHPSLGVSVFEGYTLIAMAIYGLALAGTVKVVSITRY
jgi:hypothetical protein